MQVWSEIFIKHEGAEDQTHFRVDFRLSDTGSPVSVLSFLVNFWGSRACVILELFSVQIT